MGGSDREFFCPTKFSSDDRFLSLLLLQYGEKTVLGVQFPSFFYSLGLGLLKGGVSYNFESPGRKYRVFFCLLEVQCDFFKSVFKTCWFSLKLVQKFSVLTVFIFRLFEIE